MTKPTLKQKWEQLPRQERIEIITKHLSKPSTIKQMVKESTALEYPERKK